MSSSLAAPRMLRSHWDVYEQGAREAGRTTDRATWRISRDVHVAETTEQARKEALEGALGRDFREYFLRNMAKGARYGMIKDDPALPDEAITPEYLLDHHWIVGDPDEVARQVRALYDRVGGFGMLLTIAHDWPDPAVWDRSMRLLAQEVMPQLADLGAPAMASA